MKPTTPKTQEKRFMMTEPSLPLISGSIVPQLAFGLYKVPVDEEGVGIILRAIKVCQADIMIDMIVFH